MFNPFKIKELMAFIIPQFISTIGFMIILLMYDLMIASMAAILLMIVGVVIGKMIIKNPFLDMLKGDGIITFPLDSKGVVTPFISKFNKGSLVAEFNGEQIKAPFDRKIVFNMAQPSELKSYKDDEGSIFIRVDTDQFNMSRAAMFHIPVLFYNQQMRSFITKDWLSEKETETFSRHHIIHANRIAERLTEQITDFGRYIADHAVSKFTQALSNPWIKNAITILVIGLLGFLLLKFAPAIMETGSEVLKPISGNTIMPNP